jgi:lysozyme
MKTSQVGLDFIAEHEGLKLTAYPDPGTGGEPFTIGVGRAHGVKPGDTCTKHEALQWLAEDVETAEKAVLRCVSVPLNQEQFDALVSFTFNCGAGNLASSTLLKLLNNGDYAGAKEQFQRWNKAAGREMAGLTKRRHAEAALFDDEYMA